MKDAEKIRHFDNLIKLIKACPYWAADQNFELVQLYVEHVVDDDPVDKYSRSARSVYHKMFSIINEENKEHNEDT